MLPFEAQEFSFELPIKVSTNVIYSGIHWTKRAKHKDMFLNAMLPIVSQIKPIIGKCRIEYDYEFQRNALDSSNCSYMSKIIEDCLRHYKKLTDDTVEYVTSTKLISRKNKSSPNKVTVRILSGDY